MKNEIWAVTNITTQSSLHGGYIERVELIKVATGEKSVSYLDPRNRNYQFWNSVLAHRTDAQLIKGLKTKTHEGRTLINADSQPEQLWWGTHQELDEELRIFWAIERKSTFSTLFE
jgi:hypothetical protein